ncbi:restriction endonuclease subunit S [Vibrio crassostreae]|uniref:Type I restriction-modification system specificity subunit S n=2 Tax=Vibrio TaxID=662 RepID=A0ABP1X214_9VIBR|nr:restriction endonuclease subunit S [Vibrio crassostreae]MDH5951289.1 restriction endonuclease subunit S [Vibrio crassostreae]TCT46153.1 type I restriction enzyme S subunit [Vibrio crassostreae]TCT54240.1 type I restriction enzyme S subunit [Vibrio crassostreae]TCT58893.1 type I restriction enzyme S subunit [Vibrio crassostreae]TCT80208.1 type I restriction enzyme S subunit [Vibrio crassostreae]
MTSNWETVQLKDIVQFKTGKLDSNAAEDGGQYPFFTCSPTTLEINTHAFDTEAVLLAGNNANGVFAVKYYKGKFNAYQRTYVITPLDESVVCVKWLYFRIKHVTSELQKMSVGTATKFLTKKILDAYEIELPPIEVQEQQAQILWGLQDKLDLSNQTNQTLEQMAQAIFKSWFVDFDPVKAKMNGEQPVGMDAVTASLFPEKLVESELGLIPEGWDVGTLSDVAKYCSARTDTDSITLENYISTENMLAEKKGVTAASKLPTAKTVAAYKPGDILVSNIRPYFKKIWLAEGNGGRSNDVLGFEAVSANTDSYLMNLLYQDTFFEYMTRTSKGAKMPRGDKTAIMNWDMALPPVELREAFSAIVDKFYQLIPQNRAQNATLESLRDTLLPKLLSGEIELETK